MDILDFGAIINQGVSISDGFHTFDELYDHRITIYIALCRTLSDIAHYDCDVPDRLKHHVWRAERHSDGSQWKGWFILGLNKEAGRQITYHLPIDKWDQCDFATTYDCAPEFDGHSPADVLERLAKI